MTDGFPDPNTVVLVVDDLDTHPCTLRQFLQANPDLDHADYEGVWALRPGEVYAGGGGAGATWTVRRIT